MALISTAPSTFSVTKPFLFVLYRAHCLCLKIIVHGLQTVGNFGKSGAFLLVHKTPMLTCSDSNPGFAGANILHTERHSFGRGAAGFDPKMFASTAKMEEGTIGSTGRS